MHPVLCCVCWLISPLQGFQAFPAVLSSMLIISVNIYLDVIGGKEYFNKKLYSAEFDAYTYLFESVFILTPRLLLKNNCWEICPLRVPGYRFSYFVFLIYPCGRKISKGYELYQFWLSAFLFISFRHPGGV